MELGLSQIGVPSPGGIRAWRASLGLGRFEQALAVRRATGEWVCVPVCGQQVRLSHPQVNSVAMNAAGITLAGDLATRKII